MNTVVIRLRKLVEKRTHCHRTVWVAKAYGVEHRGRSAAEAAGLALLATACDDRLLVVQVIRPAAVALEGGAA